MGRGGFAHPSLRPVRLVRKGPFDPAAWRRYHRSVTLLRHAGAVALAAQIAGCATASGSFRCPAAGGPPWRELASDHFVLRTDLDHGAAMELVRQLEIMRAAVKEALFGAAADPPGRVEVVAFRTIEEYQPFDPGGARAYYLRYEGGPPRIVLAAGMNALQRMVVAHELTHHLASGVLLRQPRWLSEGLATYMESLGDQRLERTLVVGAVPRGRLVVAREAKVEARDLFRWESGGPTLPGPEYYAAAWLLVHYLLHQRQEAFAEFISRLARGEELASAWNSALPEYSLDRSLGPLDRALRRWALVNTQDPTIEELDRPQQRWARAESIVHRTIHVAAEPLVQEQPMAPVEVHALRIALARRSGGKAESGLRLEIGEALREDPAHPLVLEARASLEKLDPLPLARASVEAHPDDPRAWTFLGASLAGDERAPEREAAYRRAAELAPDNPAALYNLGTELLDRGRSGEGLPSMRRAASLAPWSAAILDRYAAVLADLGRCADAIRLARRALDVLPEQSSGKTRDEMQARLEEYRRRCAGGAGARAPSGAVRG